MRLQDGAGVLWDLQFLLRAQRWSRERVHAYQRWGLIRLMRHAVRHVPYYRTLGIDPDRIDRVEDLDRFPPLTKTILQEQGDRMIADRFRGRILPSTLSSGSTLEPSRTYFDPYAWRFSKQSIKIANLFAICQPIGKRILVVNAAPPQPAPQSLLQSFARRYVRHLSIRESPNAQLECLLSFAPQILFAYPSFYIDMLEKLDAEQIDVPQIPTLLTSSEHVTPRMRRRIEIGFRGTLFDIYGSTEFKNVAWQCAEGSYHVNFASLWLRVDGTESYPGESPSCGELEITTLSNYAMPLIRFMQGDRARLADSECGCGRSGQTLAELSGRNVEMLALRSGRRISAYLLTSSFENHPDVGQYQIVELGAGRFRIDYTARRGFHHADELAQIASQIEAVAGEPLELTFKRVAEIPRALSGKYERVRRDLAEIA